MLPVFACLSVARMERKRNPGSVPRAPVFRFAAYGLQRASHERRRDAPPLLRQLAADHLAGRRMLALVLAIGLGQRARRRPLRKNRAVRSASRSTACRRNPSPCTRPWPRRPATPPADRQRQAPHSGTSGVSCVPRQECLWIGSTQATASGFSTGSMSRLTTTASLSERTSTHSSGSSVEALIS